MPQAVAHPPNGLKSKEVRIFHGDRGYSYPSLFADYLQGARKVALHDPYIRTHYQVVNFLRFCEVCVEAGTVEKIDLVTACENELQKQEVEAKLRTIQISLAEHRCELG